MIILAGRSLAVGDVCGRHPGRNEHVGTRLARETVCSPICHWHSPSKHVERFPPRTPMNVAGRSKKPGGKVQSNIEVCVLCPVSGHQEHHPACPANVTPPHPSPRHPNDPLSRSSFSPSVGRAPRAATAAR